MGYKKYLLNITKDNNIHSILETSPSALKKNVYSAVVGYSVLYMSVSSNWYIGLFKAYISL